MNLLVEALEFDAGVGGREAPVHLRRRTVALELPGRHRRAQGLFVRYAPFGALAG
jgi:hypothetical protein